MSILHIGKVGTKGSKKITVIDAENGIIKLGSMSKGKPVEQVLGLMPKGDARKLRKTLRNGGFPKMAGAVRRAA